MLALVNYITINLDPVLFKAGPFSLRWYGLMYVVGIAVGLLIMLPYARQRGVASEQVWNIFWGVAIASLIGGRLYYVLQNNPGDYLKHPGDIFAFWQGGMAFFGADIPGRAGAAAPGMPAEGAARRGAGLRGDLRAAGPGRGPHRQYHQRRHRRLPEHVDLVHDLYQYQQLRAAERARAARRGLRVAVQRGSVHRPLAAALPLAPGGHAVHPLPEHLFASASSFCSSGATTISWP